ncbi:helix-turn-helix domain-containing protein [Brevibacillus nitrificans]|uniref:helix-turn-helix domain-containing protein n=1 Tax=Brevibacillus nitrificans TaxID=651560 RepID=UPI0028645A34|nr:helix-turn-helix domain-containing protein [Brevibacillus nitrificans]MDR7318950.1 putative transcriptional regulator [Brevibacillus nitrificans]
MSKVVINQSLSTFASVADMDMTVRQFLYTHVHKLTESAKQVLLKLARYSCKVVGVSWPEAETIAPSLGISVRTFWRALKQLESFGIIQRISGRDGRRKQDGTIGGNAYQIQPLENLKDLPSSSMTHGVSHGDLSHGENGESLTAISDEALSEAPETVSSKALFSSEENLKTEEKEIRIPNSRVWKKVPKNVPTAFATPVMRDTADGQVAFRLWGKVLLVDKLCGFENPTTLADIASETWKRTRSLYKERDFNKFCGLFYGALKRVTAERFPLLDPFLCKR